MSDAARQAPVVSGTQVVAAGFASATAAFVTSRFGVAGTLLGAAVTAMIITGGSAILRGYFETVTGRVRKVPGRLRARSEERKARRYGEPETLPERPDLRDNFAGRMRAAMDWFSHLPPLARRSILVKGLIAAAVAFVIGMGAVWGVERVINNSLSCGFWANCPEGASPGIHINDEGRGANSTISLGRAKTQENPSGAQGLFFRQNNGAQQNGLQQNRSYQQESPGDYQRAPLGAGGQQGGQQQQQGGQQGGGLLQPDRPVEQPDQQPVQQEAPSSASPAPEEPLQQETPSSASPAPEQ